MKVIVKEKLIFYPQYCLSCEFNFFNTEDKVGTCPLCRNNNVIDYKGRLGNKNERTDAKRVD